MWRHEDLFFAGLQGGNPGGPDITAPEQLGAERGAPANPTVTLPVAPLMHGNGHWSCMIGMHGGGKVVLAQSRRLDAHEIWSLVEREKVSVHVDRRRRDGAADGAGAGGEGRTTSRPCSRSRRPARCSPRT